MDPKAPVLVTDGHERSALAVTRRLGCAGIPVIVGAETARSLVEASRYCVARWWNPSLLQHPSQFVASLVEAIRRFDIAAIIPPADSSVQAVAAQEISFGLPSPQ